MSYAFAAHWQQSHHLSSMLLATRSATCRCEKDAMELRVDTGFTDAATSVAVALALHPREHNKRKQVEALERWTPLEVEPRGGNPNKGAVGSKQRSDIGDRQEMLSRIP